MLNKQHDQLPFSINGSIGFWEGHFQAKGLWFAWIKSSVPSYWIRCWCSWCFLEVVVLLLMEEILHHLGYIKPCRLWDIHHINLCRISSINSFLYPHDWKAISVCQTFTLWPLWPFLSHSLPPGNLRQMFVWDCLGFIIVYIYRLVV